MKLKAESQDEGAKSSSMTSSQVLEKAIQKAIDGGWEHETVIPWRDGYGVQKLKSIEHLKEYDVEHIIFNHQFAKALWWKKGKAKMYYNYPINWGLFKDDELQTTTALLEEWQYHLQQMVIADDLIEYLEKAINDSEY